MNYLIVACHLATLVMVILKIEGTLAELSWWVVTAPSLAILAYVVGYSLLAILVLMRLR